MFFSVYIYLCCVETFQNGAELCGQEGSAGAQETGGNYENSCKVWQDLALSRWKAIAEELSNFVTIETSCGKTGIGEYHDSLEEWGHTTASVWEEREIAAKWQREETLAREQQVWRGNGFGNV